MLFYTHLLLGILAFLGLRSYFSGGSEVLFFLLVLVGSLWPDLDEGRSRVNHWAGILGRILNFLTKHRGLFHSLIFGFILFGVISLFWENYYAWGFLGGFLTHLLGDGVTRRGIRPFYPFSEWRLSGPVKVGGLMEGMIGIILLAVVIMIVVRSLF